MHAATTKIVKVFDSLRPTGEADFWVSYVNANEVPVKRRVLVGAEIVDNVALAERRAA